MVINGTAEAYFKDLCKDRNNTNWAKLGGIIFQFSFMYRVNFGEYSIARKFERIG